MEETNIYYLHLLYRDPTEIIILKIHTLEGLSMVVCTRGADGFENPDPRKVCKVVAVVLVLLVLIVVVVVVVVVV